MMMALYLVARHEAELSLPKCLMIAVGVNVVTGLLGLVIGIYALAAGFTLAMWAIHQFLYVGWGKSAIVSAVYFISIVIVQVAWKAVFQ